MMFLGNHAFTQGLYDRAIQWLEEAATAAGNEGNSSSLLTEIVPSLQSAIETVSYTFQSEKLSYFYRYYQCVVEIEWKKL